MGIPSIPAPGRPENGLENRHQMDSFLSAAEASTTESSCNKNQLSSSSSLQHNFSQELGRDDDKFHSPYVPIELRKSRGSSHILQLCPDSQGSPSVHHKEKRTDYMEVTTPGGVNGSQREWGALVVDPPSYHPAKDNNNNEPPLYFRVWQRASWLIALLLIQSVSSGILKNFEELLNRHMIITFFLTMLVGMKAILSLPS